MDLIQALEARHSKANTDRIVAHLLQRPDRIPELIALFLGPDARLVQRSSWVIGELGRARPALLAPHHASLLAACRRPKHPAVLRNVLRYYAEAETCPEALHGELADLGFSQLADPGTPVAIRVHAMQLLYRLLDAYPELAGELRLLIEDELPRATPGFRSRGQKILRAIERRFPTAG